MKLPWLKAALDLDGPYVSVYLDTSRNHPQAAAELSTRWEQMRHQLAADGAPEELLEHGLLDPLEPPKIGGRHGRALLAAGGEIVLNRVLPVPPLTQRAHYGEVPELLPLVQLTPQAVSQLLVEVDRAGADLHLRSAENPSIPQATNGLGEDATVEGGHDDLTKSKSGGGSSPHGWRTSNFEARVEDSWERNAESVAATVNRIVTEHLPDMVLVTGDARALALLEAELGQEVRARLHQVPGGTRGVSMDRESFREELARVTQEFIDFRLRELSDRFHESQQRGAESVSGAEETAQVLERGQVDELLFVIGREPKNIESLIRQAIATDAGVSALPTEAATITEGVGALLRWRDDATPSTSLSSMSGDARREDAVNPDRNEVSPHAAEEAKLRS